MPTYNRWILIVVVICVGITTPIRGQELFFEVDERVPTGDCPLCIGVPRFGVITAVDNIQINGGASPSQLHQGALIERENQREIPSQRIVLAGFSQGAAMALHVGLRYPEQLGGIVALSTYMVRDEGLEDECSEANRAIPIFQAHGSMDPMVRPEAGQLAYDRLTALGYPVTFKAYPMGHEVHPQEIDDVGRALDAMLNCR